MSAARPPVPARDTGLPPGVRVGPLGRRFVAYVVDSLIPAVAGVLIGVAQRGEGRGAALALVVVALILGIVWALVCWQQLAVRAATPGMRLMRLQLVGFLDGRPVMWGRAFLRWLVFAVLSATGLGLLLLIVSVLVSPRRQGWHDRAAGAVVIVERPLPPRRIKVREARAPAPRPRSVPAAQSPQQSQQPPQQQPVAPQEVPRQPVPQQELPPQQVPVPVPTAVAGDPAVGPELAPMAGDPELVQAGGYAGQVAGHARGASGVAAAEPDAPLATVAVPTTSNGGPHRTILEGWVAELDDGREIAVHGLVLLGRNPQPAEGEADAELVKLPDESRTVSKTHLALGVDDAGLFVVDRGSTNGSTITAPGRPAVPAGAFHAVSVSEGSVVSIGDHWVRIRRSGG